MYTTHIPTNLARALGDKEMPCDYDFCTYAEVFDWLPSKGIIIDLNPAWNTEGCIKGWVFKVYRVGRPPYPYTGFYEIWEEAANNAIRKALELI